MLAVFQENSLISADEQSCRTTKFVGRMKSCYHQQLSLKCRGLMYNLQGQQASVRFIKMYLEDHKGNCVFAVLQGTYQKLRVIWWLLLKAVCQSLSHAM